MAFVILSAGTTTSSKVRTLSARALGVAALATVGLALLAGLGIGYGIARSEAPAAEQVVSIEPESCSAPSWIS